MKVVLAIGGNALVSPGGRGDITEQFARSRIVAKTLADLVIQGCQVTVTHGNGPQVGSIMRRVEISSGEVYPIDLGLAVADTQAGMGYMISQTWRNELHNRGNDRECITIVTPVIVDANDPAFANPTKPIGPFFTEEQARLHAERDGWKIIEDSGRGWRRIVASPRPKAVECIETIKKLVAGGELLIAGGGKRENEPAVYFDFASLRFRPARGFRILPASITVTTRLTRSRAVSGCQVTSTKWQPKEWVENFAFGSPKVAFPSPCPETSLKFARPRSS